jgi:hypothetical protein
MFISMKWTASETKSKYVILQVLIDNQASSNFILLINILSHDIQIQRNDGMSCKIKRDQNHSIEQELH